MKQLLLLEDSIYTIQIRYYKSPERWDSIADEFNDLDHAASYLEEFISSHECAYRMRVVDQKNQMYCVYDPLRDMRHYRRRKNMVDHLAEELWNPREDESLMGLREKIHQELEESNGIFKVVNGNYTWNS